MKKITIIFITILFLIGVGYSQSTKKAEFAGSWYPEEPNILNDLLDRLLSSVKVDPIEEQILGVIVPHAGYIYSAPVAAYSFKILENKKFDTIILLGSTHRYYFEGVSIYPEGSFQTPLGNLEVDNQLADEFKNLNFIKFEPKYFYGEHCLEVELPFVKKVIGSSKILPILFGKVDLEDLKRMGEKMSELLLQKKILIVVSTDLSHYHSYEEAIRIDKDTISLIQEKNINSLWNSRDYEGGRACGISPLIAFLEYSRKEGAEIKILKYANSGDTMGDKTRVVGYLSAVAYKSEKQDAKEEKMGEYDLNREEKITLLKIARSTLENYLKEKKIYSFTVDSDNLKEKRGAFVTLKKKGELRGCIGRIVADIPLYEVISKVAIDSALNDSRFLPVKYEELKDIEIEISVLTPFVKVQSLEEIKIGEHGLMVKKGFYSGLLLPQVPIEYGWDRETFLEHTCLKAGLPASSYKDKDTIFYRFSAIVFSESDLNE